MMNMMMVLQWHFLPQHSQQQQQQQQQHHSLKFQIILIQL